MLITVAGLSMQDDDDDMDFDGYDDFSDDAGNANYVFIHDNAETAVHFRRD